MKNDFLPYIAIRKSVNKARSYYIHASTDAKNCPVMRYWKTTEPVSGDVKLNFVFSVISSDSSDLETIQLKNSAHWGFTHNLKALTFILNCAMARNRFDFHVICHLNHFIVCKTLRFSYCTLK